MLTAVTPQRLSPILGKSSHYDDNGYMISWLCSAISSNSLAALYGLALGETYTRIRAKA